MRTIDMQTWSRREHFELFSTFDYPHFGMCANVDLTAFYLAVKQRRISFNLATVYVLARAANAIPEFRYRIRVGGVVEHEIVHPSTTILTGEDLFSFCTMDYIEDFSEFAARAAEKIARVQENPTLGDEPGQDNLLYMTVIPWVSFTSFMHPLDLHPADSVPRFAWGKFFEEGEFLKMPLSVQAHHALVDGVHMGKYYEQVQDYLNQPEVVLGKVGSDEE
jgi:chloramphenicol O-acetyltransferase type A